MCSRTIAMLILDFMKFEVSEYNFPDFLARRFMFVVRLLLEQAAVGSSFPLGMLAYSAHRGCVILGCIDVWLVQLECSPLTSFSLKFMNVG